MPSCDLRLRIEDLGQGKNKMQVGCGEETDGVEMVKTVWEGGQSN